MLFITLDMTRYRPFVPVIAWMHIAFGCVMLLIDLDAALPWWWTVNEGPWLVGYGIVVLIVYRRANRAAALESHRKDTP